jgi:hypothetical protein
VACPPVILSVTESRSRAPGLAETVPLVSAPSGNRKMYAACHRHQRLTGGFRDAKTGSISVAVSNGLPNDLLQMVHAVDRQSLSRWCSRR